MPGQVRSCSQGWLRSNSEDKPPPARETLPLYRVPGCNNLHASLINVDVSKTDKTNFQELFPHSVK